MSYVIASLLVLIKLGTLITAVDGLSYRPSSADRWRRWCTEDFQCGRGYCLGFLCHCHYGFSTWYYGQVCSYELKKKRTALLLSFFVGVFGIDWFFLARGRTAYIIAGIIKLSMSLTCSIGWPLLVCLFKNRDPRSTSIGITLNACLSLTSFIWWLTDWIRVLADLFKDGNGVPLQT